MIVSPGPEPTLLEQGGSVTKPQPCHTSCATAPDCCAFPHCPSPVEPDVSAAARQTEQIAHYRRIANENGYCGGIVWSRSGDIEGPCAREVGHEGGHQP